MITKGRITLDLWYSLLKNKYENKIKKIKYKTSKISWIECIKSESEIISERTIKVQINGWESIKNKMANKKINRLFLCTVLKYIFKKYSETTKRTGSFNGKGKTKIDFSK